MYIIYIYTYNWDGGYLKYGYPLHHQGRQFFRETTMVTWGSSISRTPQMYSETIDNLFLTGSSYNIIHLDQDLLAASLDQYGEAKPECLVGTVWLGCIINCLVNAVVYQQDGLLLAVPQEWFFRKKLPRQSPRQDSLEDCHVDCHFSVERQICRWES